MSSRFERTLSRGLDLVRLRLDRGASRTDRAEALRLWTREGALAALRRLAADPWNRADLRRLIDEHRPGGAAARLSDEEILREVAALLISGRVRLREGERLPGTGLLGQRPREEVAPAPKRDAKRHVELTWIEIQLLGEDDQPIPGERYRITLPDRTVREGTLDGQGLARVEGIEPGECEVTFPQLDEEAWEPWSPKAKGSPLPGPAAEQGSDQRPSAPQGAVPRAR